MKRTIEEEKQVLVDMAFQFMIMLYNGDVEFSNQDNLTRWMRRNYAEMGFEGKPMGLSHYVLDRNEDAD